jgi:5-methyltetrahydropteroyltriglutamate--homocysteine methyltransferase
MSTWRADVVGSLLRPGYLMRARAESGAGRLSSADFKRVEDRAVDQAVALQEATGVDVVTDGEMRRFGFTDHLWDAVDGFEEVPADEAARITFHGDRPEDDFPLPVPARVVERISRRRMITPEEFAYVRGRARLPVKVTLPSPLLLFPYWSDERSRPAYRDAFELFADAAALIRAEANELASMGCRIIQIDAPDLGELADPSMRAWWEAQGMSVDRALSEGTDLVNSVADVPGITFALHLCKGNARSRWIATGGYEALSKQIFGRLGNYRRIMLEYDDERSGSFEPLADLPDDKIVVLGLVSSKREGAEPLDDLAARVAEAARYVPLDRLAVSTQCGFASVSIGGNEISEAGQEAKLRTVADLAARLWP